MAKRWPAALLGSLLVLLTLAGACGGGEAEELPTETPSGPIVQPATRPPGTATPTLEPSPTATPYPQAEDGIAILPCDDILVPVNKTHRLTSNCTPGDLIALPDWLSYGGEQLMRAEAARALEEMAVEASREGVRFVARSSFRSFQEQAWTFDYWVSTLGRAEAERTSARPGHSEHQLGTTTDLTSASVGYQLSKSFGEVAEGRWVAENAWRFGFVVSYPAGKEHITGYDYEPWHVRYVGREVAAAVREHGVTLHEYLSGR
jgi:D-alanyl-D-alanine carboxypeptidase